MPTKKKLIIFDLDGTLAESKSVMDAEMANLMRKLLAKGPVAIITGGTYGQFEKQFLKSIGEDSTLLKNLYLFPTCATCFWQHDREKNIWKNIYSENLDDEERKKIKDGFAQALKDINFQNSEKIYGQQLEDRGTQVTFSALGQEAPADIKKLWDPNHQKREIIKKALEKYIPEFEIRIGGATSVDVTRKGIDKAYGIRKIEKYLGIPKSEMLFIGDALFPGGNDYPVKTEGVECIETSGSEETKKIVKSLL